MKETSRRRISVTSSLNKISADQLGKRVVVRGGGITPLVLIPFYVHLCKDDVNGFSSIADICFMVESKEEESCGKKGGMRKKVAKIRTDREQKLSQTSFSGPSALHRILYRSRIHER
jgi:hypothetical protein